VEDFSVTTETIALIDDDAAVRKALARVLRSAGFSVTAFESAEEFLAQSPITTPDCLVLDINLTGMSGLELRQTLLRRGMALSIVFITAGDDAHTQEALSSAGVRTWLRKPIGRSTLVETVRHAIDTGPNA
jgi:FixJ family two-component response regulator